MLMLNQVRLMELAYGIIDDHVVLQRKFYWLSCPTRCSCILEAWEKESLFLNSGTVSEIQPKVEGLLRATSIFARQWSSSAMQKDLLARRAMASGYGDMSKRFPLAVADLKKLPSVGLPKNLGIAEMPPKVCSNYLQLG